MFAINAFKSSIAIRLSQRCISTNTKLAGIFKKEPKEEEEQSFDIIEVEQEDPEERQYRINRIRDKSGLFGQHRRILHGVVPYEQSESWVHETLKYKRKMYAQYGSDSKLDPKICFWTKAELEEKQEYERVAYPKTVPEMIAIAKQQKRAKQEKILARDNDIAQKLLKLDQWKRDLEMKKEKKETDARIARERKDRLIEEVRRHFGYTVDPKDERFKEMLELKEKEQRKAQKASKRQDKESKMMAKLLSDEKNAKFLESKPKSDEEVDEGSEKK